MEPLSTQKYIGISVADVDAETMREAVPFEHPGSIAEVVRFGALEGFSQKAGD